MTDEPPPNRRRPPAELSVAMLTSLMDDTLDPGYREAAARRRSGRSATPGRTTGLVLVSVGVLVAGLVFGVAFTNDSRAAPDKSRAREALVTQVRSSQQETTTLTRQVTALRAEVTKERDDLLADSAVGGQLLDEVTALEYSSGQVAVHGDGIRLSIADPPSGDGGDPVGGQAEPGDTEALIQDRDLQKVVNALWNGGAAAIAINGQRLGPTTAIRQAGGAILVDFLPLASPYVIDAIGPYDELAVEFAGSAIGRKLMTYRNVYQAELTISEATDLQLKPALAADLGYAEPVSPDGGD